MSPGTHIIREKLNPIPGSNEMRTKIWGVKCVTGLRYKQIGMKKYCITQAVLEPNPFMIDEGNFVSVMVVHNNGEEHLMAVLRHGQIYQVNLNMLFDRDKDVAFYLVGRGTVYLLGYEVILPKKNRGKLSLLKGVKASSLSKVEDDDEDEDLHLKESDSSSSDTPPQKHSKSLKSGKKKKKSVQQVPSEKISAVEVAGDDDDDDDDEEDSDFCVGDDEFESSESEICDASEEEVEVDESEIQYLIAEREDPELMPASKKRKQLAELQHTLKRSKMDKSKKSISPKKTQIKDSDEEDSSSDSSSKEKISKEESSSKEDEPSQEESINEFSESDAVSSCNGISKKASKLDENETSVAKKKKKKKKKKAQEPMETPQRTCKILQTKSPSNKITDLKKLREGVEVQDLKVGHGPTATCGKMVHMFYVARLQNKSIFDSRLPGKQPFSFKMGANQVLKGLDIGIEGMKSGGKRRIKMPPSLGYGKKGNEEKGIPPNSTLHFIIDIQAVS